MALAARAAAIKFRSRELRRSSGPLGARAELLSVEDPLVREKSPRERLRGNPWIETSIARAVAWPLERPVSSLTPVLFPRWAYRDGLGFNPRLSLFLLVFISF